MSKSKSSDKKSERVKRISKKSKSSDKKSERVKRISQNNNGTKRPLIEGEERKVHEEIIDERITGGVHLSKDATMEAYARALKQWQELPGSIVRPPTDITLPSIKHPKPLDTETTDNQTNNDTDKGGK